MAVLQCRYTWIVRSFRGLSLLVVLALAGCGFGDPHGSGTSAPALTLADPPSVRKTRGGIPFRLPEGYIAERVAESPMVAYPMFACFDDRGRLYVAGSSGHNSTSHALLADPPDVIRRLEDTDGDGFFDESRLFAARLTYPQGVLWHDGAIYVASPPSLWKLEDTTGDGVADHRTELVTGFPFTGIADDLHGPCLGPDARLYWGVGRFDYEIHKPNGPLIRKGNAPLVMRCRPDGEEVEVYSAAMGNPVEMTFNEEGEVFACGTFLSPAAQGEGLRDALIHCVQGGLYSVRDRDLSQEIHTGDFLPPMAQLGVAAGSGMMMARGEAFGGAGGSSTIFAALFNLHSVPRFKVERTGATFTAVQEPFLESSIKDFHPTDVLEDADGSLLVLDTGGWFQSCPTSRVEFGDRRGAIYRIRRINAPRPKDPWGLEIDWQRISPVQLGALLGDTRFRVREHAVSELVRRGEPAVNALRGVLQQGVPLARVHATWALARQGNPAALAAVREALENELPAVRLAAATAIGLNRDLQALAALKARLVNDEPAVRREIAAALGRLGRPEVVPDLLRSLAGGNDRYLEHATIYALIQLNDRENTLPGLHQPDPAMRRGALIALDQMKDGRLTLELVAPLLDPAQPELRDAAMQVIPRHPEWAQALASTFRKWFHEQHGRAQMLRIRRQMIALIGDRAIQALIPEALRDPTTPPAVKVMLLEVIASTPHGEWDSTWEEAIATVLTSQDEPVVRAAVSAAHVSDQARFDDVLLTLARDPRRSIEIRIEALDTVVPRLASLEPALFETLLTSLGLDEPLLRRLAAARAIGRSPLDDAQLTVLTRVIPTGGAMILPRILPAFERSKNAAVGVALLGTLEQSPALASLTPEALRKALKGFPIDLRRRAEPLLTQIDAPRDDMAARLSEIRPLLAQGDPHRGSEVFFTSRATCSSCHTIRGKGGHVGPNLSMIGAARSPSDLLEAILYPSASFARGYEPYVVATRDGHVYNGLIIRETANALVLATPERAEIVLSRRAIEEIAPAKVSIMPQGLDANLSRQELIDLIAYLGSLKGDVAHASHAAR